MKLRHDRLHGKIDNRTVDLRDQNGETHGGENQSGAFHGLYLCDRRAGNAIALVERRCSSTSGVISDMARR